MQKGLDLLLEVFPRLPDLHLWACGPFEREEEFCACYRRELYETPNIHPVGWVGVAEPQFAEIVRRCASVIHPTCSEGQPGSVVHCMHQGLIPLVTPEAGIDTEDFGVTLDSDDLGALERLIAEVAARPEAWHEERSRRTRAAAARVYDEDTSSPAGARSSSRWKARNPAVRGAFVRGERGDSNPRPPGPQPGALPAELRPPRCGPIYQRPAAAPPRSGGGERTSLKPRGLGADSHKDADRARRASPC